MLADLTALHDDPKHSTERARITGPRRRRLGKGSNLRLAAWIGVVAMIVAGVVLTVTFLLGGSPVRRNPAVDPGLAVVDAGVVAPPPIDAAPTPAVELVKYTIVTLPPGATLYEGSRELGTTPYEGEWPVTEEKIVLVASLDGFDDAECTIRPRTDRNRTAKCKLAKVKTGAAPVLKGPRRPGSGGGSGAGPGTGSGTSGTGDWGTSPFDVPDAGVKKRTP
jgi:hypothetical protein